MQYSKKIYSILTYLYCLLFIIHYSCPGGGAAGRRGGGAAVRHIMMTAMTSVASFPFGVDCIRHLDLVLKTRHRMVCLLCESSSGLHCILRHNGLIPLPFHHRWFPVSCLHF
jgi:hypothetical protein